jgi:repressor LexA
MTAQQRALLDFIRRYITEHQGVSPSFDEMRDALGLASRSGIHRLVTALKDQGYIATGRKAAARQIEVLRLPGSPPPASFGALPAPARPKIKKADIARHIAAQPWCAAPAETVLASLREIQS